MKIVEISATNEEQLGLFYNLARQVYANDPCWAPQSESAFQALLDSRERQYVRPLLCMQGNTALARAVAILHPSAVDDTGAPVGYIGFFECLEQTPQAGSALLASAEQLLREQGSVTVQFPRVDNMLMGLVVERFDLPQTILTMHNPPYYAGILLENGYKIREKLFTYIFSQKSAINLPLFLPGFHTRTFNRQNLDDEVQLFHDLQKKIFSRHPGWVPRTLDEDRQMIEGILPVLDDDLVIFTEDKDGSAVGLLICLPDIYQANRGQVVDNARAISIGVIEPLVNKGLGVLMGLHLSRNLIKKGYRTMEASWIRENNIHPQNMLTRRFLGQRGREFALFEKRL